MTRTVTLRHNRITLALHHLREGDGRPLLFLHGVCRGWRDFAPVLPAVLPRWRVLAIDFRGHGKSDRTPHEYHVADYALDALAVLSAHVDAAAHRQREPRGRSRIGERLLQFDHREHRIERIGERRMHPVAHHLDDAAAVGAAILKTGRAR